jgi:RNA recognition motif-containing protein
LKGKAFAKFSTKQGLDNAVELHGTELAGRRLRIEAAAGRNTGKPKTERDPESTTVFVGGINYYTNE